MIFIFDRAMVEVVGVVLADADAAVAQKLKTTGFNSSMNRRARASTTSPRLLARRPVPDASTGKRISKSRRG